MNELESEPKPSVKEFFLKTFDKKYYWGFGIGTIVLITTIILIHFLKDEAIPWLQIFAYPLLAYFIFQQVLSGFGFITGYIPIAQGIISWLSKTSKKKAYSEKEARKWDKEIDKLEAKEKKEKQEFSKKEKQLNKKKKEIEDKLETGKWNEKKAKKEYAKLEKKEKELKEDQEEFSEELSKEEKKLKEKQKQYRGKLSEKVITTQEDIDPRRFKLIMLVPIYIMIIVGIVLTIIGLINPIIRWVDGTQIGALNTLDNVMEYYKGIMAAVGIISLYIVPAIRVYRDPTKEFISRVKEEKKRRIFFFIRRKKDPRTVLNRQFEDMRKYYWKIKQVIRNALFIPIGLSMLIVAPIGGLSVVLGGKTTIQRKKMEKYDLIIQIIIAVFLIGLVVPSYFSFFASFLKVGIHQSIPIIIKLIYGSFLIYSFVLFTRNPIADRDEI